MTIDSNILGDKKVVNWKGIFKTEMPLSTCFTERGPEAIQLLASDLPENIRSLSKNSAANVLSRLGATKSPRGPQNSQHNKCYFFTFFRRAKVSAKRARSTRHARRVKAQTKKKIASFSTRPLCHVCLKSGAAPRSLQACLRSPEKRENITPVPQASRKKTSKTSRSMTTLNRLDDFTR